MKTPLLIKAIEKAVARKLEALDSVIEELIEPIADVGNPEKLIKKAYEAWTPGDLALMAKIYGTSEPNPLSELIFRKKYEEVKELEAEEGI